MTDNTKTIEERATEFAEREYEVGDIDRDALHKGYYWGAKDTMALPLASRLTDSERENMRFAHKSADELMAAVNNTNPYLAEVFKGQKLLLESIFGKEFFTDNK